MMQSTEMISQLIKRTKLAMHYNFYNRIECNGHYLIGYMKSIIS